MSHETENGETLLGVVSPNPERWRTVNTNMQHSVQSTNLADILERVLDKGIVIAGDITISLADIDLLNIKLRLLVCSVDKAMSIGINWWQSDPALSSNASQVEEENRLLHERLDQLEARLGATT